MELEQLVTPVTPVIVHTPEPVGAAAPVGPLTVAEKVINEPSVPIEASAFTATAGSALFTVVVLPEVGEDAE